MTKILDDSVFDEQIALETDGVRRGIERYWKAVGEAEKRGDAPSLKPAERLLLHWLDPMVDEVRAMQRDAKRGIDNSKPYWPILLQVDAKAIAVITVHEMLNKLMHDGWGDTVAKVGYKIGKAVIAEYYYNNMKKQYRQAAKNLMKRHKHITPEVINRAARKIFEDDNYSIKVATLLGVQLAWKLLGVASTEDYDKPFERAFMWVRRNHFKTMKGYFYMTKKARDMIYKGHKTRQYMKPAPPPMIHPPWKYTANGRGGYTRLRFPLIGRPKPDLLERLEKTDTSRYLNALNAVNSCSWKVSRPVLDTIESIWSTGGGAVNIPLSDDMPFPVKPVDIATNELAKREWKKDATEIYKANIELSGVRSNFVSMLEMARLMSKRDAFWLPHKADFRLRHYPIHPYLNHQGDDISRGLMLFANPVAVTDEGMKWLKLHLASCYGVNKISHKHRLDWVEENMNHIRMSAADPINYHWWTMPDKKGKTKPLQLLSACMAVCDPDGYGRYMPVQIDGKCNGMQHYSAMGRDSVGAGMTSMIPSDGPSDVYTTIADRLRPIVCRDANNGVCQAMGIADHIDRNFVKHTVMTTIYGVTDIGAREQMESSLNGFEVDQGRIYETSKYLVKTIKPIIREACPATIAIMDWFVRTGRAIVRVYEYTAIGWTSPIYNMPIIQPYRKLGTTQIKTALQQVSVVDHNKVLKIRARKQVQGFAPNFNHTLDATHFLMTAERCNNIKIQFAGVHDCDITHASHIPILNKELRSTFVELHKLNPLEQLRDELIRNYPKAVIPELPPRGDFNLDDVLKSEYFFDA